jgi:hypothetical protein
MTDTAPTDVIEPETDAEQQPAEGDAEVAPLVTTTKTYDYMHQALQNPTPGTSPATDYLGRAVQAGDKDYMGRALGPFGAAVRAITPAVGVAAGGTVVTIVGNYFTGATGVTFGGTAGTAFAVTNDGQLTVTTPVHAVGPVAVVVQSPNGNATVANGFTYQ